ncbi:hypothetical protein P3T76_002656 [Phytophthora citrophthora]|uniref:Uncharacterized protein n=1 Tax=Phytophthora citrophthora TaxID=4793 RepID=A0AAD9LQ45_9STRA|nr:hypothetical protein P3T76_002656 [Phytophthora citrophthora]
MEDHGNSSHEEKFRVYNEALVHASTLVDTLAVHEAGGHGAGDRKSGPGAKESRSGRIPGARESCSGGSSKSPSGVVLLIDK